MHFQANANPDPLPYPSPYGVNGVAYECTEEELSSGV